jgi:hypothetical protein
VLAPADFRRTVRTRNGRLAALALAVLASFYVAAARRSYFFDDDAAHYVGLAEALLSGDGYAFEGRAHTRFPPGTPLAYAPVLAWAGRDFAWIYRASVAWSLLALAACYAWLRVRRERRALELMLVTGLSATWIEYSTGGSLSEAPFAACTYAALLACELAARGSRVARVVFPACAAAAFYVRTLGVAWLAAALASARTRDRRARRAWLATAGALGLAVLAWFAWSGGARGPARAADFGHEASYVDQWLALDPHAPDRGRAPLGAWAARCAEQFVREARHVAEIALHADWLPARAWPPWMAASVLLVGLGLARELRRKPPLAGVFLLASLVVLWTWPFDEGRRFLMPFVPLLLLCGWSGVRIAVRSTRERPARAARLVLACAGAASLGAWLDAATTARPFGASEWLALAAWAAIAIAAVVALTKRSRAFRPRLGTVVVVWSLAWLALGVPSVWAAVERNLGAKSARQEPVRRAAEWLVAHARPGDVTLATPHAPLAFATGLDVRPLPVTADAARLLTALAEEAPRYLVILDARANEYKEPSDAARRAVLERAAPSAWREVHHANGFAILESTQSAPAAR